jgi:FAD:protein FMN transferase
MKRRRFLQISAATLAGLPSAGRADGGHQASWRGLALGAEVSVTLTGGDAARAEAVLSALPCRLRGIEAEFSLYDPASALSALNRDGYLTRPSPAFAEVLNLCDRLHAATGGLFDPTVQPLWEALSTGQGRAAARALIGWSRVDRSAGRIKLAAGQRLTLNGIAQGYATDLVRADLAAAGYGRALVNIGEYAALGGPWRIGIADPEFGRLAERRLSDGAIATSSARATLVGGQPHILHPRGGRIHAATVSVEADSAALADGLSTALILAEPSGAWTASG